jgi:plasmid stabilization system protein ParE
MARVVWSRVARDDLQGIIAYIRTDAPAYARSFALRLSQRITQLETFPESGRFVPEDPTKTYRELPRHLPPFREHRDNRHRGPRRSNPSVVAPATGGTARGRARRLDRLPRRLQITADPRAVRLAVGGQKAESMQATADVHLRSRRRTVPRGGEAAPKIDALPEAFLISRGTNPRWTLQIRPNVDGSKPAKGADAQAGVL